MSSKLSVSSSKSTGLLHEVLRRVARLLPSEERLDWCITTTARWVTRLGTGTLVPVPERNKIALSDLLEIDRQKEALRMNTLQFCNAHPANHALLWGARGTGKSSLIHALVNEFHEQGVRLVEVRKSEFHDLAEITEQLRSEPYRFLLFCDDLSFEREDASYKQLKSLLEGSTLATAGNVLVYATSNRRHLVVETMRDNLQSTNDGDLHESEAIEEKISLSDRFGLWLPFHAFKQEQYLAVVQHWLATLQMQYDSLVQTKLNEEVRMEALRWALNRGSRSGRTAKQFATDYVGRKLSNG